jgi:antitoxin component of MazEF toxin-antitoxin module
MLTLKLKRIGTSTVLILPREMSAHLQAKEGQAIFAEEVSTGYTISATNPRVQKQVSAGENFMDSNPDVFAGLAKGKGS